MRAFAALSQDLNRSDKVFEIADIVLRSGQDGPLKGVLKRITKDEGFNKLFAAQYRPKQPPLQSLMNLPAGTLGRALGEHMTKNGLNFEFFPPAAGVHVAQYFGMRARQTHDIFHVLTGYDTSPEGEMALQAFVLAQFHSGFPAIIISAGILFFLQKRPLELIAMMDMVVEGYTMGKNAKFLLGFAWEEHWSDSLEDLRREFCVQKSSIALLPLTAAEATP